MRPIRRGDAGAGEAQPNPHDQDDPVDGSVLRPEPIQWKPLTHRPILDEPGPAEPILDKRDPIAPILEQSIERSVETPRPARVTDDRPKPDLAPDAGPTPGAEFAAWIARSLLVLAAFAVPVVVHPSTVDAFNLAKSTVLWVLVLSATVAWCVAGSLGRSSKVLFRSSIVRLALGLLAIATLAALLSPNRTLSLVGLYHRYEGLVSTAMYVAVLLLIVLAFRGQAARLRTLVVAVGSAAGVVAAYVFVQQLGLDPIGWRGITGTEPENPIGNLGNSAFTASFLGIATPFVVYLAISGKTRASRIAWSLVGVATVVSLLLTQGRAGVIAAVAGIGALALFASGARAWTKIATVVAGLAVLLVLPVVSPSLIETPVLEAQPAVADLRSETWAASLRMLAERPVLGWGQESFYGQYPRLRKAADARENGLAIPDKPHNVLLGWATSTGIVGLAAYVLLFGFVLRLAGARTRGEPKVMTATFAAGLVAYLAQGVYSVDIPPLALMAWLSVAGVAVLAEPSNSFEGSRTRRSLLPRTPIPAVLAAVAGFALIVFGLGPLRADLAAWQAERRSGLGWSEATWRLYADAIRLHPIEPAYRGLAASYLERMVQEDAETLDIEAVLRRAAALYERASSMQPENLHFMIGGARAFSLLGEAMTDRDFSSADRLMRRVVSLDPLDPEVYELRADLHRRWAEAVGGRRGGEARSRARELDSAAERLREAGRR
jgi:O-antigen ligase